ncbi:MAG: 3-demethylubiquinone-9 3-O-methyltransferase [Chloroflexi bacterium]|nr:3-demethylubiquinone-9 3-O-methyltransferase [Chloroflexota bacterium]
MPIDNQLYNRPGDIWWDETEVLSLLRTALNPARFPYFRRVLTEQLQIDPVGKRTLDVGCGGGLLAEEFARLGCRVTGIDPSESSIETARAHAARSGLGIKYVVGAGESLPFRDESFDIVYCCDVLEHVSDLDRVVAETARVLKPGGVYLYDTINRTLLSKLVMIKLFQEWEATSLMPPNLHDWTMFIKPAELRAIMERHGLEEQDLMGMRPAANPVTLLRLLRKRKRGRITFTQLAEHARFKESKDRSASYMGYALRTVRTQS